MSDPTTVLAPDGSVRTAEEAKTLGIRPVDPSIVSAQHADERRRAMFDTFDDKVGTFVEGVVDALSLGIIRETGEEGDLRRDVNAGSALFGNALGFAAGMTVGGPVRGLTKGAESAGKAAAKAALRSGEGQLASRVAAEAAASMALAGAQASGHALMDSIIEDKEFSSEAILDEVKLAGIMGGVGGLVLHGLGKVASRADIQGQGGVLGNVDDALKPHIEATRAYDDVLERHAAEVGAMKELERTGAVPREAVAVRTDALGRATKAREALDKIDMRKAMSGTDDVLYRKWQAAGVEYRAAIKDLDAAMSTPHVAPRDFEAGSLADDLAIEDMPPRSSPASVADEGGLAMSRSPDFDPMNPYTVGKGVDDIGVEALPPRKAAFPSAAGERYTATKLVESTKGLPAKAKLTGYGDPAMASGLPDKARVGRYTDAQLIESAPGAAPDIDLSDARMARMKDRLAATSGDRAAAKARATLADIPAIITDPVEAVQMASPGKAPRGPTREIPIEGSLAATPTPPTHKPIAHGKDLPDWHTPGAEPRNPAVDPDLTGRAKPGEAPVRTGPTSGPTWETFVTPGEAAPIAPPKPRPIDAAEARVQRAMADLVEKTGGRLDSASALGLLEKSGIRPAADNVGSYMDQVYALRKAGVLAADATRGASNPLKDVLEGAAVGGLGHMAAGPMGATVAVIADMLLKKGGRVAASTGRLMAKAAQAANKLLTSTRVRAVSAASANTAYAYSDRGPIEDPVERIQEIQWLAANPVHVAAKVAESAQDLADQPQLLQALQARTVNQLQRLALRAPAIYFDKLGRPLAPPGGKMREFFEYENAIHDLAGTLDQLAAGTLTGPQAAALQEGWPSVHIKVTSSFMQDPEKLRSLPRATLRAVETITGLPLTNAKDPAWLMRQSAAWIPPAPPVQPQAPQAFNINPTGAPTPAQSNATGRAPGN